MTPTLAAVVGDFGVLNWAVLGGYLLAILLMGVYFSRREKSTNDFFLAGRRIPWWAAGLSIVGTGLSAITFMGFPAKAYAGNWIHFTGNLVPILIVPIVILFYLPFYRRLNVTTAYEYLEKRFNLVARLVGGLLYICFQFLRMAVILYLPALAMHTVAGLDIYACILAMGLLCTVYTVLGGVEAVIWTDVLQVVVLMGAAIVCLGIIAGEVDGGLVAVIEKGRAAGKFKAANFTWDPKTGALWLFIVGRFFGDFMPNTADQGVIQRYLTVPDLKSARRAAWVGGLSVIPVSLLFFSLGTALWAFYQARPELIPGGLRDDQILPLFMVQQMPAGVAGLAIAGLFAAAMSSVDSSMNSVSAVVTTDGYRRFRPQASEQSCLRLARWITGLTGLIGTVAALIMASYADEFKSTWDLFLYILFWMGSPLAGMFVLGVFTRRANGIGACVGAAAGAAGILAVREFTELHGMLYPVVGLGGCVVTGYLASLLVNVLPISRLRNLSGLTIHTLDKQD
ncbi:MAG: sodium:solute symporter [Phycisphaerae bacterium]|jgi:SSS family transporter|nr:sodium:solute symporter [Phycisphaerae bacterium]